MSDIEIHNHKLSKLWSEKCELMQDVATKASSRCGEEYGDIIRRSVADFCNQSPPRTNEDFEVRAAELLQLSRFVGAISSAAISARRHPHVARQILAATKAFSKAAISTGDMPNLCWRFATLIAEICRSDRDKRPEVA
ncbi:hypothetical protein [Novipirellula caenicola]|uniref:Uncharacterized protein n=1 Tax=Novipirellula caenicola TaxID=1536901 RepID=A0ABP9VY52_9BACT